MAYLILTVNVGLTVSLQASAVFLIQPIDILVLWEYLQILISVQAHQCNLSNNHSGTKTSGRSNKIAIDLPFTGFSMKSQYFPKTNSKSTVSSWHQHRHLSFSPWLLYPLSLEHLSCSSHLHGISQSVIFPPEEGKHPRWLRLWMKLKPGMSSPWIMQRRTLQNHIISSSSYCVLLN